MNFTDEQKEAINTEGTNILVSAGAGSGKTEVLSQRVLRKLKEGVDIRHILILTFTNEAAKEMSVRIRKKIEETNLKDQLDYLDSAYITTFDAFSLNTVKKYHYLLDISDNISIIEESIIALERKRLLEEIMLEYYQNKDDRFLDLIGDFTNKDDEAIKKGILNINKALDLKYNKEEYLSYYLSNFYSDENINDLFNEYFNYLKSIAEKIENLYYELESSLDEKLNDKLIIVLEPLFNPKSYQDLYGLNLKLPTFRNLDEDALKVKEKLALSIKELKELTIYSEEELKQQLLSTKDYVSIIIEIILKLDERLNDYKLEHEAFEFNDIAKMAIKIVAEHQEIAADIKESFQEIMIDEYQDTNDLQELFISYISNNNVYMVGDIKQSIYGFRQANPEIFKQKMIDYQNNNDGKLISLTNNFRSRREVLKGINDIFGLLMTDDLGGIDYANNQALNFGNEDYESIGDISTDCNLEILEFENETKEFSNMEIEAFSIVKDIESKLNNNYEVYDFKLKQKRKATYQDFCIILDRGTDMTTIKKIFEYFDIPMEVYKDDDLLGDTEIFIIKNIISLILNIKNENYDKEMRYNFVSIARSFLSDLTDAEIFDILEDNKIFETSIYQKCNSLASTIDNETPNSLLNKIIEEFNFYERLIRIGNIEDTLIRIEYILEISENMENLGFTIGNFKDYLERVIEEKIEIKYKESKSDSDCVKLINIHKSKGLEFPICYFMGYEKGFNMRDLQERFIYNKHYGIVTPFFKEGIGSTFLKTLVKNKYYQENISEKVRLFYVALTRTKEKMVMIVPKFENSQKIVGNVDYLTGLSYRSFYDFIASMSFNLKGYIKEININNLNLTHAYEFKKDRFLQRTDNNQKIEFIDLNINSEKIDNLHASKTIHNLLTKEENKTLEFGTYMHEMLEITDFKNYQGNNKYVLKLLNTFDFKTPIIYQELEFYFNDEASEYHGIIDLMLEYEDNIKIIDYKLKNIEDEEYIKQLNVYYNYVSHISNKKINLYLYSILDNKVKEIEVIKN